MNDEPATTSPVAVGDNQTTGSRWLVRTTGPLLAFDHSGKFSKGDPPRIPASAQSRSQVDRGDPTLLRSRFKMQSAPDWNVEEQVTRYLAGACDLHVLQEWLIDATGAMERTPERYGPSIAIRTTSRAYRAVCVIAEYTGGDIDVVRLRESLGTFVAERSVMR